MALEQTPRGDDRTPTRRSFPAVELHLGRLPVRIEASFLLVVGVLGLGVHRDARLLSAWVAVALVSIALHEIAHAVAALAFGGRARIVLNAAGGRTERSERVAGALENVVVSLAGPAAQTVLLGLPALFILHSGAMTSPTADVIVRDIAWISLGWAAINLLPILPLDGGTITTTLLRFTRVAEPLRLARTISAGTALGISIWAWQSVGPVGALCAALFAASNALNLRRAASADAWSQRRALRSITTSVVERPEDVNPVDVR
jgi:stage IV sporulation protein FB